MTDTSSSISLRTAAIISGVAILVMAIAAPFAEMYVYPTLVEPGDPVATTANMLANRSLFAQGIFGYLLTFMADIVAAWSLYILFRPVSKGLSRLTAWFRLSYSILAIVALLNLVSLFRLLHGTDYSTFLTTDELQTHVMLSLQQFKKGWSFGIILFGVHLLLLGYLILKSKYIPTILGWFVMISGAGYFLTELNPYFFPDINMHIAVYTFFGELVFMLWLLIRGYTLKAQSSADV